MNAAFRIGEQLSFFFLPRNANLADGENQIARQRRNVILLSGPDELGTSAAVKLAASEPLTAAMEALNGEAAGSKQDKRGGKPSLVCLLPLLQLKRLHKMF